MTDYIIIGVVIVVVVLAGLYIRRAKKRGKKCVGCPDGASCPSGNCAGCSYGCSFEEK